MEKILVSKFRERRFTRNVLRRLFKSLGPKHLRALNTFVTEEGEIFVAAVLAPKVPAHIETFTEAILSQGHLVEMTLDEFIEASLKAPEAYIGVASKFFPAVKP